MRARKSHIRAVKDGEPTEPVDAPPAKPLTLAEAVEIGDYRTILIAQRREIARSLPEEKGPAKAALHRQLSMIAKELQALDAAAKQEAGEGAEVEDEAFDVEAL